MGTDGTWLIKHYKSNLILNKKNVLQELEPAKKLQLNTRIQMMEKEVKKNMG